MRINELTTQEFVEMYNEDEEEEFRVNVIEIKGDRNIKLPRPKARHSLFLPSPPRFDAYLKLSK